MRACGVVRTFSLGGIVGLILAVGILGAGSGGWGRGSVTLWQTLFTGCIGIVVVATVSIS